MKHLLLIIPFLLITQVNLACDCAMYELKYEVQNYTYIFVGKVIGKKPLIVNGKPLQDDYYYIVQVAFYYKGNAVRKKMLVESSMTKYGNCAYPFKIGERYLFCGRSRNASNQHILTDACTYTQRLKKGLFKKNPLKVLKKIFTKKYP